MYLAERRHRTSTRMIGLIGTAAAIAMVGVVLVNMHETVQPAIQPRDMIMFIPETPKPVEPPPPADKAPRTNTKPIETPLTLPSPVIDIETDATPAVPPTVYADAPPIPPTEATPAPSLPAGPPATRPRLMAGAKPGYPLTAQRLGASGTTTLDLCVSRSGRVTQAGVAESSGNADLDAAALNWIKRERFQPGTENGQPVDMCGHTLAYQWVLPTR